MQSYTNYRVYKKDRLLTKNSTFLRKSIAEWMMFLLVIDFLYFVFSKKEVKRASNRIMQKQQMLILNINVLISVLFCHLIVLDRN